MPCDPDAGCEAGRVVHPVADVPKLSGGHYEAWPDDKLLAFEHYCDANDRTTARIVYELCVGTGQRLNVCVNMKWDDFDG